eukprot:TRINITY_DN406_c0_g1_i1.p1 TRINITY_DN406_c0_g1~~TRINITY_DN406_c0_g1_i1.p1  ORF type:complete len:255 (-),score=49.54 TRINITY_DN406_c0_g1_i1:139-903(-)
MIPSDDQPSASSPSPPTAAAQQPSPHVVISFAQGEVMQGTLKGVDESSSAHNPYGSPPMLPAGMMQGTYVQYPHGAPHNPYNPTGTYPPHPVYYPPYGTYPPPQQGPYAPQFVDVFGQPQVMVQAQTINNPYIHNTALMRQANIVRMIAIIDVVFSAIGFFIGYWWNVIGIFAGLIGYMGAAQARPKFVLVYANYLVLMVVLEFIFTILALASSSLNTAQTVISILRIIIQIIIIRYVVIFYGKLMIAGKWNAS